MGGYVRDCVDDCVWIANGCVGGYFSLFQDETLIDSADVIPC